MCVLMCVRSVLLSCERNSDLVPSKCAVFHFRFSTFVSFSLCADYYCPTSTQKIVCPEGYFCPPASTAPKGHCVFVVRFRCLLCFVVSFVLMSHWLVLCRVQRVRFVPRRLIKVHVLGRHPCHCTLLCLCVCFVFVFVVCLLIVFVLADSDYSAADRCALLAATVHAESHSCALSISHSLLSSSVSL